jgi:hypothetical protein
LNPSAAGTNSLAVNGLGAAGVGSANFAAWFAADPSFSDMVMRYLVKCGVAAGSSVSFTDANNNAYSWAGELGLTPGWAGGAAITADEQQLISACLAAHGNKFGVHVVVSIRGYDATGTAIPILADEQANYTNDEGCFFGNLFDGSGVFTAYSNYTPLLHSEISSLRACAADNGAPGNCAPIVSTGSSCQALCTGDASDVSTYFEYKTCRWNGVDYKALTTRLSNAELATCGDGVCQASETCFDSTTQTGCLADCGSCQ